MAQVVRATQVEAAIEQAIAADQGRSFRRYLGQVIMTSPDAFRDEEESFRSHMGASIMGEKCGRAIWYSFRWATKAAFTGRMVRLFNRGHLEEPRFIAMLMTIGATIYQVDANGKQYRITGSSGHYGGSGDGIAANLPGLAPGTHSLLEFKTHNDDSFKKLVKEGVRSSKFEHFAQMQQYMRKMGIPVALYMAVNKNTDELYCEWVALDSETADLFIDRADKIVWMQNAPPRIGSPPSPGNWDCKWCQHRPVCFLKAAPAINCRTCVYSNPSEDGKWTCRNPKISLISPLIIPEDIEKRGCQFYERHPDMGS